MFYNEFKDLEEINEIIEKSEKEVSLTKFTHDKLLSFGISKDVNLEAASALKDPAIETNSGHEKAENP